MKRVFLLFFIVLLLFSNCSLSFNYKEVEVILKDEHPFESASNMKLWYTLSYTNEVGNLLFKHLCRGKKSIKLWVRKDRPIFICAKPFNKYSPLGGIIKPGDDNRVVLDFKNGYLVEYLQSLYLQNSKAVSSLNYDKLFDYLNKKNLLFSFDKLILARDLLNGTLSFDSIYELDNLNISLEQAIDGYWISENPDEGGFNISDKNYRRISLSLGDGEHYYINFEKGYSMNIIVDTRKRKYFVKVEEICPEFL